MIGDILGYTLYAQWENCSKNQPIRLQEATKAALKPQQKLFALRTMVIPGIYHQLELDNTSLSQLRKCDRIIRHAVREWLSLPGDSLNNYIYANIKNGGLDIDAICPFEEVKPSKESAAG